MITIVTKTVSLDPPEVVGADKQVLIAFWSVNQYLTPAAVKQQEPGTPGQAFYFRCWTSIFKVYDI
jgi:hypothetical protein